MVNQNIRETPTKPSSLNVPMHASITMASRARLLCLLLLLASFVVTFASLEVHDETNGKVSANINQLFDAVLPTLQRFVIRNGLDPLRMQNITQKLEGMIIHNGVVKLTKGWLQGFINVKRSHDVVLSYEKKLLTLDMSLLLDVLDLNYKYDLTYGVMKKTGDFHARLIKCEMKAVLLVDFRNYSISIVAIKVIGVEKFEIKLEGHLLDPILNAVIKIFTAVFRREMLKVMEKESLEVFQKIVDILNAKIPPPDKLPNTFPISRFP